MVSQTMTDTETRLCSVCREIFRPLKPWEKYCSIPCRRANTNARQTERRRRKAHEAREASEATTIYVGTCEYCHKPFRSFRKGKRYCNTAHAKAQAARTRAARIIDARCCHCDASPATRSRGLCYGCSVDPAIRERYPSGNKFAHKVLVRETGVMPKPTLHVPGTPGKCGVLAERYALGQRMHHPLDAQRDDVETWSVVVTPVEDET